MSQFLQGFVIDRNLEENTEDLKSFNNLGGSPIASDLSLLRNNKRNISSLTVTNANINTTINYIVFVNVEAVFTNGTKLTKTGGGIFYVKNSNGFDRFQLSFDQDLISTVTLNSTFSGVYNRSDEITNENFKNIKKNRRPALEIVSEEEITAEAGLNELPVDPFSASLKAEISTFEKYFDYYTNIRNKTILRTENFSTDLPFLNIGYLSINDPDNFNNLNLTATNGPGLFIYNSVTGNKIRAFSDSNNVWAPNVANTFLETSSNTITTGSLTITNNSVTIQRNPNSTQPLVINATTASAITTTGVSPVFTHKMKIYINEEEFYICMSNNATVV